MLYAIDGENEERETIAEKIARLEQEISDLNDDLENERQRADEQYDRAENLSTELEETKEELESLRNDDDYIYADEDDVRRIEIGKELKAAYERLNMGILSEVDEIIKLTNEILELHV